MSKWSTYAKAAARTAQKQAPEAKQAALRAGVRSAEKISVNTKAAVRTAEKATRDSRRNAKVNASAYAVVAQRKAKENQIGKRIFAAIRDAVLMALSVVVIWFVVSKTGAPIPFTFALVAMVILALLRMLALFTSSRLATEDDDIDSDEN